MFRNNACEIFLLLPCKRFNRINAIWGVIMPCLVTQHALFQLEHLAFGKSGGFKPDYSLKALIAGFDLSLLRNHIFLRNVLISWFLKRGKFGLIASRFISTRYADANETLHVSSNSLVLVMSLFLYF